MYTRYLTGQWPTEYVVEKYRDFHALGGWKPDAFDSFLVETSARGVWRARLVDSYASRFQRDSVVRKKLVLTLAILECVPPFSTRLDTVDRGGPVGAIMRMGLGAVRYAACVVLGAVLFTPVRLGLTLSRRSAAAEAE